MLQSTGKGGKREMLKRVQLGRPKMTTLPEVLSCPLQEEKYHVSVELTVLCVKPQERPDPTFHTL